MNMYDVFRVWWKPIAFIIGAALIGLGIDLSIFTLSLSGVAFILVSFFVELKY